MLFHIVFENLLINDSTFSRSSIEGCTFTGGEIVSASFINAEFENVIFENTVFKDTFFFGADLKDCTFKNTKGLSNLHFYNCKISKNTKFVPPLEGDNTMPYETVVDFVNNSGVNNFRKSEILNDLKLMEDQKNAKKPSE